MTQESGGQPTRLPTKADITRTDLVRHVRGVIYLEQQRLRRLEGAWPDRASRTPEQRAAIGKQRRLLAEMYLRARREGIQPWRRRQT